MQQNQLNDLDELIASKQRQLRQLTATITERTRYYKAQERMIADMIETGNSELLGLNYEIKVKTQHLRDLKVDIRTATQDRKVIYEEISSITIIPMPVQPLVFTSAI